MVTADKYLKALNCQEVLQDNIDKYKEVIIKYYGEENRAFIEEKFNTIIIVACMPLKTIRRIILNASTAKAEELCSKIISDSNTSLTNEDLFDFFPSFEYPTNMPIDKYQKFYDLHILSPEERKQKFIEEGYQYIEKNIKGLTKEEYLNLIKDNTLITNYTNLKTWERNNLEYYINLENSDKEYEKAFEKTSALLKKINPDINFENFSNYETSEKIQELNKMVVTYKSSFQEYTEFMNNFSVYKDKIKDIESKTDELNAEYIKELIKENIDLIPQNKRDYINEYLETGKDNHRYIYSIFGYDLSHSGVLEQFSSKEEQKLKDKDASEWITNSIKKSRINYFISNGIDLGNDYESYVNSEEAQAIWPSPERIDAYLNSRNMKKIERDREIYMYLDSTKKIIEEIKNKNYAEPFDIDEFIRNYESITAINPILKNENEKYSLDAIMYIGFDDYDSGYVDHYICHEINHAIELSLVEADEESYTYRSGWDIGKEKYNEDVEYDFEEEKRKYELFNEVINEEIAKEMSEMMIKNGIYIFDYPETVKYKNYTNYESTSFIIEDFYNEFKDKIIESRRNNNIKIIFGEVGKENFDSMNDLFKEYYELTNGFYDYKLKTDLYNHRETEATRKYYEIVAKKDNIMEKMREHKQSVKEQNKKGI